MSCLCQQPKLLDRVVPKDQGFSAEQGYCGAFRFNFWVMGNWTEVVIDDRLPINMNSDVPELPFTKSPRGEYWPALMEKAFAKYDFHNCTRNTCT